MILVAGGTGLLGRRLVRDLLDGGERVRAFARGVHPFPDDWPASVERVAGDLKVTADCERAVAGCTQVVFAASGFGLPARAAPRAVDRDGAIRLVKSAAAAGVDHVVMMSMHGAAPDAPIDYLRCKYEAEEALKKSGVAWTIIRMGVLLEQWIDVLTEPLEAKGAVTVFGRGTAPVTFTSLEDASAIVRRALVDPELRGRTLEWGSDESSLRQLAEALVARAGRGRVRSVPSPMLRVMSVAARPFSPLMARMAGAGAWMDGGGEHFAIDAERGSFPDIPIHRMDEVVAKASA